MQTSPLLGVNAHSQLRSFVSLKNFAGPENFFAKPPSFPDLEEEQFQEELEKYAPVEGLGITTGISGGYAAALFSYGGLLKARDQIENNLQRLLSDSSPAIHSLLHDKLLSEEDQIKLANEYLTSIKAHPQILNLFTQLIRKNLLWLLPRIANKYFELQKRSKGIVEGEIITILPLPEERMKFYVKFITESLLPEGKTLILKNKVDPSLLGGAIITVEGETFDFSSSHKLEAATKYYQNRMNVLTDTLRKSFESLSK